MYIRIIKLNYPVKCLIALLKNMDSTSHSSVSILKFISRIQCNAGNHTRKFHFCLKHSNPTHLCKLCLKKSKQLRYAYICQFCSQGFCLHHFLKHTLIFKNVTAFAPGECMENGITNVSAFMNHFTPKKCHRYSQSLTTDAFRFYLELTPEEYKNLSNYLIAFTKPGAIKNLSNPLTQ
jgi:hypothetical protein